MSRPCEDLIIITMFRRFMSVCVFVCMLFFSTSLLCDLIHVTFCPILVDNHFSRFIFGFTWNMKCERRDVCMACVLSVCLCANGLSFIVSERERFNCESALAAYILVTDTMQFIQYLLNSLTHYAAANEACSLRLNLRCWVVSPVLVALCTRCHQCLMWCVWR